jgi:hypothetical protein
MSKFLKAALVLLVMAVAWPAPAGAAEVDAIDGPEDFTLLAGDGYSFGVPGGPGTGSPYTELAGTPDNTYNWSGMHFDPDGAGGDPGMLLMGTLQNTFAFNQGFESRRAQIWRYDIPSTGDPRQGDWTLAWESPLLVGGLVPVPECVGMRGATYTNIGGVPRAVFSCTGGLGQLIGTTDGINFTSASTSGLGLASGYIGFRDIAAVDWDDNGTDDALLISPVGVAEDDLVIRTDLSPNDVMLINTNPFGLFSRWREASEPGFGNDENLVNFATKSIDTNGDGHNDAVAAVATNRVTGAELYVATEGCTGGFLGGLFGGACNMDWELVFDAGVGKPLENVNCDRRGCDELNPDIRNPNAYGSDFTQVGETVYVTLGETAFQGNDEAADETEVMAVYPPGSADCPAGADCSGWVVEILMGDPREGTAAALESSILNFHCTEMTTSVDTWCVPTSYMTASFGEVGDPGDSDFDWGDLDEGAPFYTWRAASDGTHAYFTTAGSSGGGGLGFELWRLEPDGSLTNLFRNLGDGNLGGRTLFYADPLGIIVGTATFETGTDIFVGGCYDGPPIADAGPDQVFFDRSGNNVVEYVTDDDDDDPNYDGYDEFRSQRFGPPAYVAELKLDGSASRGAPCDDLTDLTWYAGTTCTGDVVATWTGGDLDDEDFGIYDPGSFATRGGIEFHEYSLEATATEGGTVCTRHTVTASSDLPPVVDITAAEAVGPDTIVCNNSLSRCAVVDMDEDGTALVDLTAECTDAESAVVSCEWSSSYSVTDISPDPILFEGARTFEQTPAGDTVRVAIDASSFSVTQCTGITENESSCQFEAELDLEGEDINGFTADTGMRVNLVPPSIDVQIEFDTGGSDACDEGIPGAVDETGVCILPQDTPIAGTPVEVWVQVENDGSIAADVTVTLDVDGNGTVTYLDDPAPFPYELPPFGVEIFTKFSWTPASTGETTLTAEITSAGSPADNDPEDNIASRDFDVADAVPAAVDLEVTSITPTTEPAVDGAAQNVTVRVTNNGTTAAAANGYTVELHSGGTPIAADQCDGDVVGSTSTVAGITTGLFADIVISWTPDTVGTETLCADVTIASDEVATNNALDTSVTVDPVPAAVDLEVTAITTGNPATTGESQTVTVTVTNNGTNAAAANGYTVALYDEDATAAGGTCGLTGSLVETVSPSDGRLTAVSAAGGTALIDITWTPGATGSESLCAQVTIASDEVVGNDALDQSLTIAPDTVAMHLSGLSGVIGTGFFFRTTSATATVVDSGSAPVSGATVSFSFTRGILGTGTTTCVTNGAGTCTASGTVWFATSSTWTVTSINAAGAVYDSGANTAANPITVP